ncbi:MAG: hypothetical protein V1672_00935 [Candidatus Diapherotrites archaeon]
MLRVGDKKGARINPLATIPSKMSADLAEESEKLILQIDKILKQNNFTTSAVLNSKNKASNGVECINSRVYLYGVNNLKRWSNLIGFSNPKNICKFNIWQEKGYLK